MKIARIHIENFIGAAAVDLVTTAPIQLITGHNAAGKSSIRDAVALALTADLTRVNLKKDAAALIHEGASSALCEITDADGDAFRVAITRAGKITDSMKGRETDPVLPYVLDAQRFARLDPTARRAFLFGLMNVSLEPAAVKERLLADGIDAVSIDRVVPLLRAGFDAAAAEAKRRATEAKGAWKLLTGETWGSQKGETWRAAAKPFDPKALAAKVTELTHADVAVASWQQSLGAIEAEAKRRTGLRAQIEGLRGKAALLQRAKTKLGVDQQTLADVGASLLAAQTAAGDAPRVGLLHDLAAAVNDLVSFCPVDSAQYVDAAAALQAYEREHGPIGSTGGDPEARESLPRFAAARDQAQRTVDHDLRDVAAAESAGTELKLLEQQLADAGPSEDAEEARKQLNTQIEARTAVVAEVDRLRALKTAAEAVETKTASASKYHAEILAWDQLGDALGPNGLPAKLLAEALAPINDRLARSALDAQWPRVEILDDMTIRVALHERPYALLSESERWRCDAMLAEAISSVAGAGLLVLDRADVLDGAGRQELLSWLDAMAEFGEIATALVFATLKAPPSNLPPTIDVHWMENGAVGQLKEAA